MRKLLKTGLLAGLFLVGLTHIAFAQNVAIVNGKAIPKSREDALVEQVKESGRPITPELQGQIRNELVAREVFAQEAQKQGVEQSAMFKNQMELMRQTVLIATLFADYQKKHPVTDAEAKAEYDKFVAANTGKEYKARHILVDNEDLAKKIIGEIKKGAKFEDEAKKYSKDTGSAAHGGDLDWANSASYVKEFSDAMVKLNKGQMTDTPVKSQFGYHIIQLQDVRQAKLPSFDEVKPEIVKQMTQQRLAAYQQELRSKAKVE